MSNIQPFRFTTEDLPDLDNKTRDGIAPLLDALNLTLQQLVALAAATPQTKSVSANFTSQAGGSAYVDFSPTPLLKVYSVQVDDIRRTDGVGMSTAYAMSWTTLGSGLIRVLFVGLDVNQRYFMAVTLK